MAAVGTLLCGSAVAGQQRFRRRAAPSLNAHVSYGPHLACRRQQLRPALFPAPSFVTLSSPAPASRQLLRTQAAASSSDSAGSVSLVFPPLGAFRFHLNLVELDLHQVTVDHFHLPAVFFETPFFYV